MANARSSSTFLRAVNVPSCSSHSAETGSSSTSAGSTCSATPSRRPSSRSSALVNAACAGPRRPSTTTSSIALARRASSAWSAMSVCASSSGSRVRIRITSAATLPLPITTARRAERSNARSRKSGWPLYQATNSVAAQLPGRSSPGIPSDLSVCAPVAYTTAE